MKKTYDRYIYHILDEFIYFFEKIKSNAFSNTIIEITKKDSVYAVFEKQTKKICEVGEINIISNDLIISDEIKNKIKNNIIALNISSELVFEISLENLPYESETVIPGIIKHQIDRKTPFKYIDILYCFTKKINSDNTILIKIYVIPKILVKEIINIILAQSPKKLDLIINQKNKINISTTNNKYEYSIKKRLYIAINSIIAIIMAIMSYSIINIITINNDIYNINEQIEISKKIIKDKTDYALRSSSTNDIINTKITTVPIVLIIDKISKFLPDDAYLLELTISNNTVKMIGISHNVENIIPSFEKSLFFIKTKFISPVTRLSDNKGDKFNIETTVNSQLGMK